MAKSKRAMLYYNNFLWKWVYMETGRRAKSMRKNSTHRRGSPSPGKRVYVRLYYMSRAGMAKTEFFSVHGRRFHMIRLKAERLVYRIVYVNITKMKIVF